MTRGLRWGVALLTTAAAACGPARGGSTPAAVLLFENQSMEQADVYAVSSSGGTPIRIGTVFAGRREPLNVRGTALGGGGSMQIVARLLGSSRAPRSTPLSLSPGERLIVTLSSDGNMLTVLPAPDP